MEWIVEVLQMFVILAYVHFLNGYSPVVDKFFALYVVAFFTIVQPAFYLAGDNEFRTDIANYGFLMAVKKIVF